MGLLLYDGVVGVSCEWGSRDGPEMSLGAVQVLRVLVRASPFFRKGPISFLKPFSDPFVWPLCLSLYYLLWLMGVDPIAPPTFRKCRSGCCTCFASRAPYRRPLQRARGNRPSPCPTQD